MERCRRQSIGSFDAFMEAQRYQTGEDYIYLLLFISIISKFFFISFHFLVNYNVKIYLFIYLFL